MKCSSWGFPALHGDILILYKFLLVLCDLRSIFWVRGDSEVMVELCVFPGLVCEVSSDWFLGVGVGSPIQQFQSEVIAY